MKHSIVHYDSKCWSAVTANNGGNGPSWQWGNEILVGFTVGTYELAKRGHHCNYDQPFDSWLARSTDGGESWEAWKPENYAGQPGESKACPGVDTKAPGFVMRIEGAGYHGNSGARWFASEDKGANWSGPYDFGDLLEHPELKEREFTGRTAYEVTETGEIVLFLSARNRSSNPELKVVRHEKPFVARSRDGGQSFTFESWIAPWTDEVRAVMPAPVRLSAGHYVVALRRKSEEHNWIDCHGSEDGGASWKFLSEVGQTEDACDFNGNPPAMIQLQDGRLCCVYGNRSREVMIARCSGDGGISWGEEQEIRDGFKSPNGWPDLGYPRLFQREDGACVAAYFWCSPECPETHIEATIFEPA